MGILRKIQDRCTGGDDEHNPDHRLLNLRPTPFGPRQQHRAGKGRDERRDLHCGAGRLPAEVISVNDADPRDLRYGEIDEYDAALKHLQRQNARAYVIDLRNNGGGYVNAVSRALHKGKRTIVIDTELYDDAGKLVARVTQTQAVL